MCGQNNGNTCTRIQPTFQESEWEIAAFVTFNKELYSSDELTIPYKI